MNKFNVPSALLLLSALSAALLPAGAARAATLLEIYQQALQSDPLIHEAEARRLAALEAAPQARGVLLPQVGFGGDWNTSESSGTRLDANADGTFGTFRSDSESETTRWQFSLRQTLFRWNQIVGLKRADKVVAKAEADREAAQQDLIVRVTQRYFDVLAAEDALLAIHANRDAIARQLEQAKQRFEVGLIAITAVQESQAAYDQAVADEIGAKRSLATAREFLREITGEYIRELAAPSEALPLDAPDPASEQQWIDLAMEQNLALVSSRLDAEIARTEISIRRDGHYPTIDLVASTGDSETDAEFSVNDSPFFPADSSTDSDTIGIEFNLPLFSGGVTSSRVREAVYLHRASLEQLQRVTRETERQTRDAYLGVISEISRVEALAQAVKSARTALEATEAGFDVGTRTIVDVLDAQSALYRAITNFYQSRYEYILNAMRLRQAAGSLDIRDLEQLDRYLAPRKSPEEQFEEGLPAIPGG